MRVRIIAGAFFASPDLHKFFYENRDKFSHRHLACVHASHASVREIARVVAVNTLVDMSKNIRT